MNNSIRHKLTERPPKDNNVWHIYTACKIKVPEYNGSFYWKDVNCKNCLKTKKCRKDEVSEHG